jgi:molybdate transport system permease protein
MVFGLTIFAAYGRLKAEASAMASRECELRGFVAVSLGDVVQELVGAFEREDPCGIVFHLEASGTLAKQIALGAPCDFFISADSQQVDRLESSGHVVQRSRVRIAENRLVIAVPEASTAPVADPAALVEPVVARIAVANPDSSPAGRFARQALGPALWQRLQPKMVMTGDVRGALNHLIQGTVDAAIVYQSDARAHSSVRIAYVFPSDSHDPIVYWGVVTSNEHFSKAHRLLQFLSSPASRGTWQRHGFPTSENGTSQKNERRDARSPEFPEQSATASDRAANGASEFFSSLRLSVQVSLLAVLLCAVPGVWVAVWLAETRSAVRFVVDVSVTSLLAVPPVVTGFLTLMMLKAVWPRLIFTWWAAGLASAIVAFPLLVRTARAAVETIDPRFARVARTLGASRFRLLRTITLPLAWRGIVGGLVLAWARALGEFGATIVVAGNIPGRTRTIPLSIWTAIQSPTAKSPLVFVISAIALSLIAVGVAEAMVQGTRRQSLVLAKGDVARG